MKYQLGNHKSFILKQSNIQSYNLKVYHERTIIIFVSSTSPSEFSIKGNKSEHIQILKRQRRSFG